MNDLENFLEASRSKTMSEASKKLGITQPAFSESIKRLESDLGEILFYRSRSGITLTPNGQAVLQSARAAVSHLSEIEGFHQQGTHFGGRVITIGCHPTVASYCLPEALKELHKKAPDYKVNLRHDLSRNIQSEIQQGRIDIGVVVNPHPSPDLVILKAAQDEVAVWTAKKGAQQKVFCNLELFQTQAILRKWKFQPHVKVDTSSLELIVRLTEAGLGYGILPERAVRLVNSDLKRVDATPTYQDLISIMFRPEFGKSKIERAVIEALQVSLKA